MSARPEGTPPSGESDVWAIISTLVAGPALWGAVGYGADQLLNSSGSVFTAIGVVIGFVTSLYIVYVRHGRDDPPAPPRGVAR